ncbi:MAG TPA: hypothetical protein ENI23_15470 [bacterium]|nr:hypothetical protein [bacterium]
MPKRKKGSISRLGFLDIEMRDDTNMPIYKSRGQNLGRAIRSFEKFLEEKYGVRGFSAHDKKKEKR